ncbi:hypothetical protein BACCOP_02751, partial [Phocaeicola coprocola DSM 17136]
QEIYAQENGKTTTNRRKYPILTSLHLYSIFRNFASEKIE